MEALVLAGWLGNILTAHFLLHATTLGDRKTLNTYVILWEAAQVKFDLPHLDPYACLISITGSWRSVDSWQLDLFLSQGQISIYKDQFCLAKAHAGCYTYWYISALRFVWLKLKRYSYSGLVTSMAAFAILIAFEVVRNPATC